MEGAGHARRLAAGSLAQQLAQVAGLVAMFAIVTVLARELTLAELGVYGLLNALAGYLLVVQNSAASAAVRAIAAGRGTPAGGRAFSTAGALYVAAGLAAGVVIAVVGAALAEGLDLSPEVEEQAQLGALLLGAVTVVGWPLTVWRDALRGESLFVRAAWVEIAALAVYAALVLGLAAADADLSLIIAASGSIPALAGLGCLIAARRARLPYRLARADLDRDLAREMAGLAGYVATAEAAVTATFTVNRVILGLFKSAATVGLYEGPLRAQNLLRALGAAAIVTVLPTAARFNAEGDERRLRELAAQGVRFTVALTAPLAVTGILLAGPLLELWLGERFRVGEDALAIMLVPWVFHGAGGVLAALLVGADRGRELARWAVMLAVMDVVLALALTPPLGLEGIALATAIPYAALFPLLLSRGARAAGSTAGELARTSIAPALALAAALALLLLGAREALPIDDAPVLVAVALAAPAAYWAAFYALCLTPAQRALVRGLARRSHP